MKKLNKKEELFCREYIKDLNQTQAYIRAGYKGTPANSRAAGLCAKPTIQARINELFQERITTAKIDADYVLQRLVEIDQLDVIDILTDDHNIKPLKDWPKAWRISLGGIDVKTILTGDIESIIKKLKFPDKLKNLELLGKHTKVQAFQPEKEEDLEAMPLNIHFTVSQPVSDIQVINAE